jgi:tRNA modification GTPase
MPETGTDGASTDTIYAPATGEGRAAVAIVRLTGPDAHRALSELTGGPLPPWRELSLRRLVDAAGESLDHALVVAFPAGASYTGEAMAEIHCHGSRAVLGDLLDWLSSVPGLRLAEPGEFTRRALMAGRMDLSEVEGLGDLIAAETSGQRRQALRIHAGAVSRRAAEWRDLLVRARALLEVTIDFADEEVPEDVSREVRSLLQRAVAGMDSELARAGPAERMRSGFEVAIVGPPNAGKSSLLNAIAGREAAIVSDLAGTTRDVVEVRLDLGGLAVTFLDTAGLREASDVVEAIGVDRARRRAEAADLRLFLHAADVPPWNSGELHRADDIAVWAKSDLGPGSGDVAVSAIQESGLEELLDMVRQRVSPSADQAGVLANVRQRKAVENARGHLLRCLDVLSAGLTELAAEELRLSTSALDRLVGRIGVEDVLDEVFAGFCLGK